MKVPCICSSCGVHSISHLPDVSLTVIVFLPTNGTDVIVLSNLPPFFSSWKLWKLDLSVTTILYVQALRLFTFLPFFVSLMMNPGPTLPFSVTAVPAPGADAANASAAVAQPATMRCRTMTVPFVRLFSPCPRRGLGHNWTLVLGLGFSRMDADPVEIRVLG